MTDAAASTATPDRRWLALYILCLGAVMIVLDTTIVNVALPSLKADLGFKDAGLAWVMNAYALTFGGLLLLGGRLGDLYGHRRFFLIGLVLFTGASLACGISPTKEILIAARAVQGVGGAVVSAVALSLIMDLFTTPGDRAKAMGVFGFVMAGGGSLGVVLGGVLTDTLSWHWIFLVNLPVGLVVFLLCSRLLPADHTSKMTGRIDIAGAVSVTVGMLLVVYAIVNGNQNGWTSGRTLGLLGAGVAVIALFVLIESRVRQPLMPLSVLRRRNVSVASAVGMLWSAGMFAWFFLSALYMGLVLHYSPLQVGLAFLPGNLIMAAMSLGVSARVVMRFGVKPPLVIGLLIGAGALLLFAIAPVGGSFLRYVLPPMILLGIGPGLSLNPLLLAGTANVDERDSGMVSGMLNTAFMMGGALGLAVLASLAAHRTGTLLSNGQDHLHALTGGYHAAFVAGAAFSAAAAIIGGVFLRVQAPPELHGTGGDPAAAHTHEQPALEPASV